MKSIDLHVHSTYSDGTLTPSELVKKAFSINLAAMALTDHDTIDGIPEAVSCAADYDIELIPGIELSTFYDKKEIHIVGLYIDYTDKNFKKELESLKQSREKRNEKIAARFCEIGIPVSYDEMKNSVTPKFTENLSKNISKITNGKYSKVKFNEETGLVVELENGDNVLAEKLSVGTIDQLYLSLRLSMVDELSEEKVPILLDEAFAFYDNSRLENILKYLNENYKNRQIIIFTCTDREKNILNKNNILFNYIEL